MITKEQLGKICRDYRITLDIDMETVAREAHVSKSTVSRFETSGRTQSPELVLWYQRHGLDVAARISENRCICCGELIPEGMQVCYACRKRLEI